MAIEAMLKGWLALAAGAGAVAWFLARFVFGKHIEMLKKMSDRIEKLESDTVTKSNCNHLHDAVLKEVRSFRGEMKLEMADLKEKVKEVQNKADQNAREVHQRLDEHMKGHP